MVTFYKMGELMRVFESMKGDEWIYILTLADTEEDRILNNGPEDRARILLRD